MRLAAASLLLWSATCLAWAILAPLHLPTRSSAGRGQPTRSPLEQVSPDAQTGEPRWHVLFARRFQEALYDPPAELPPPVAKTEPPPPPIQLLATMPESGGGHAMIADDKGITSVVPFGATITAGGVSAKVVAVRDDGIDLQVHDKVMTVKLKVD